MSDPHLKIGDLCSTILRGCIYLDYLEFFYIEHVFILTFLFIYSIIYQHEIIILILCFEIKLNNKLFVLLLELS